MKDDYREQIEMLRGFIADVTVCEQCDTRNMNAVVYCPAHREYLKRTTREACSFGPTPRVRQ